MRAYTYYTWNTIIFIFFCQHKNKATASPNPAPLAPPPKREETEITKPPSPLLAKHHNKQQQKYGQAQGVNAFHLKALHLRSCLVVEHAHPQVRAPRNETVTLRVQGSTPLVAEVDRHGVALQF